MEEIKMSEKEKLTLLEKTLEVEEGTLKPDTILDDIAEYDSLTKLSIMVMLEDDFGKKLSANDFKGFRTVKDLLEVMNNA